MPAKVNPEDKVKLRTVAVPMDVYEMIRELSKAEDRTIARQLAVLIKDAYFDISFTQEKENE